MNSVKGKHTLNGGNFNKKCHINDHNVFNCSDDTPLNDSRFVALSYGKGRDALVNLKKNGPPLFCYVDRHSDKITCDSVAEQWDEFKLEGGVRNGTLTIQALGNNKFCADESGGVICDRERPGQWEHFHIMSKDKPDLLGRRDSLESPNAALIKKPVRKHREPVDFTLSVSDFNVCRDTTRSSKCADNEFKISVQGPRDRAICCDLGRLMKNSEFIVNPKI